MSLLKDFRFMSLVVLAIAAAGILGVPYFIDTSTTSIDYISPEAKCEISENDVIDQVLSTRITDSASFHNSLKDVKEGQWVTMIVNRAPFGCEAISGGSIGVFMKDTEKKVLNFGIDIEGGTRVILAPDENETVTKEQIKETVKTLENRINFFGLKEVKVNVLGSNLIQIEMSGATGDEIRDFLAKQGKFEGKFAYNPRIFNGKGIFLINDNSYDLLVEGGKLNIDGVSYSVNDTFILEEETFQLISLENTSAKIFGNALSGEDIVNILTDPSKSYINPIGDGIYEFTFTIQVAQEGAERFGKLTRGQPVTRSSGRDSYIEPRLLLFLDERLISELNVASSLAGQAVTVATISGSENSLEEAKQEKLILESTLRSGSLPIKLTIEKVDTITQTSGRDLINSTVIVALASVIVVSVVVIFRYRDYRIVLPMVIISLSEILIVVGMASNQIFAGVVIAAAVVIGIMKREVTGVLGWITLGAMVIIASTIAVTPWTIDVPVIAGLIAILGTGVNQMIIMTDQLFKEKGKSFMERHKTAMHMIWSSAATVVFAMIPLLLGGIGILKGFAIATVVGVLVGILITRPAYVAIIEKIKKAHLESI